MEYFIAHSFSERGREWDSGYLWRERKRNTYLHGKGSGICLNKWSSARKVPGDLVNM